METTKVSIKCPGKDLKGLIWGNNAAWICECGELLGNWTKDGDHIVHCKECTHVYEIEREGNMKCATGVKIIK